MSAPDFETLYLSLNEAQRKAVDAIDGPVMVIAGPGTGKTQILAARILNILQKTDARPEEILCLTYTEAGASAMRQRLSRFMGADATRVNIHTFHGLCNKMILENPERFALKGGDTEAQRVMDDLEKLDLMDGLIRGIAADAAIKSYSDDPAGLRWQLSRLFDLMQEEDYSLAYLSSLVAELSEEEAFKAAFPELVYQKTTKFGEAGSIKRVKYDEYLKDWNKLMEAAALFEEYQRRKKEKGLYEFRDMIHWVLDALRAEDDLLLGYQERFQYLLVDEFQDTSGVQNEIVRLLISFWGDNPNCFVVGDDDQSIYAFQGARISNMLEFAKRYKANLQTVVLTENYRSSPAILAAAETVIQHNRQRLVYTLPGLSKQLTASGANKNYQIPSPRVLPFRNRFQEAWGICRQLQAWNQQGVDWQDMAVLYSKHSIAGELAMVLRQEQIPFVLARSVNILQEPLIVQLCNWLEYMALELEVPHKGQYLLYELLHSELYDIPPFEIARISTEIHAGKLKWREYLAEYVSKPTQGNLFAQDQRGALKALWTQVESWLKKASSYTVPELVHQVISGAGFLGLAMKHAEREYLLEALHTFMAFAGATNAKKPFLTLSELMEDIGRMRRNDIALPLEKRIGSSSGITLSTAHSSKGLEFGHVCIMGAEDSAWESDRSSGLPFKLGKLFQGHEMKQPGAQAEEDNAEERRRLFYVAMTRAKESLCISRAMQKSDAKGSELQPTRFLLEITGGEEVPEVVLNAADLSAAEARMLSAGEAPQVNIKDSAWLKQQVEGFKFSPTTLYDILDCGLKFYFNRIAKFPSPPSAAAGYGNAMHKTLKQLIDYGLPSPGEESSDKWPDISLVLEWFQNHMLGERRNFTRQNFAVRMQQGMDTLPLYYQQRLPEFRQYRVVISERWLESTVEGIRIGGFADNLIFNGNEVTVVDYKTGNADRMEKLFKPPTDKAMAENKLPPKYWFQLGMYQLIINHLTDKKWRAVMCQIDSLEKNDDGAFPLLKRTYSEDELNFLKALLREGQQKLLSFEFLKGCGKPDCEWCGFAREWKEG